MNLGFSVRESGVGGSLVVVPSARDGVGGVVGRRVRRCECALLGEGKTCWKVLASCAYNGEVGGVN